MERHAHDDRPAAPVALYEGPRVTVFRGWTLIVLVAACVAAGAGAQALWPRFVRLWTPKQAFVDIVTRAPARGVIGPVVLGGVTLPPIEPTIVNVWLQGCADCMPAFVAWQKHKEHGALDGVPVVNVAFGGADATFARTFGVDDQLVVDDGSALVTPLGISTFTTLLVDTDGRVLLRALPTDAGFVDELRGALAVARHYAAVEAARALVGTWRGTYDCMQGRTSLALQLAVMRGELVATFAFGPMPDNARVPVGAFSMRGAYDARTRRLSLEADESDWIERPGEYVTVDLDGVVSASQREVSGRVVGPGCGRFALQRQPAVP